MSIYKASSLETVEMIGTKQRCGEQAVGVIIIWSELVVAEQVEVIQARADCVVSRWVNGT